MSHDLDPAGVGHKQSGEKLKQSSLAGSIGAQQRDELASGRGETDTIQRSNRAVIFYDIVEGERGDLFTTCHSFPGCCLARVHC